jgi:hypothetical protein
MVMGWKVFKCRLQSRKNRICPVTDPLSSPNTTCIISILNFNSVTL